MVVAKKRLEETEQVLATHRKKVEELQEEADVMIKSNELRAKRLSEQNADVSEEEEADVMITSNDLRAKRESLENAEVSEEEEDEKEGEEELVCWLRPPSAKSGLGFQYSEHKALFLS